MSIQSFTNMNSEVIYLNTSCIEEVVEYGKHGSLGTKLMMASGRVIYVKQSLEGVMALIEGRKP